MLLCDVIIKTFFYLEWRKKYAYNMHRARRMYIRGWQILRSGSYAPQPFHSKIIGLSVAL